MTPAPTPASMNVKTAAAYLGISRYTLSEMIALGEIPFIPWRGSKKHKRLTKASMDKWLKDQEIRAVPGDPGVLLRATDKRRKN